jgi:parvulin-like peptidyl-prolyl isomerase
MHWLPALILPLLLCAPLCAIELADETVRYVNDQVISLGDVMQRNQERISVLVDKSLAPSGLNAWLNFSRTSLEELTEEELLIQYAKRFADERHFQLLDHEKITQQVLERAKASGRTMTLREQALQRKAIERKQSIEFIMFFLEGRAATIGPVELMQNYQSRAKDFYRPPRAKVLEIVLRPTAKDDQDEVRKAKLAVFKRCQEAKDPALRKVVESRLDAFLAGTPDVQQPLVAQAVAEIAAMSGRTDLDLASLELVRAAGQAQVQESKLRDADTAARQLATIRAQLEGKDAEAFKAVARQVSQGPGASDGGDRGWLEPGSESREFDDVVFALKPGTLSPVFRIGPLACLVLVTETVAARSREFNEVTAEIEATMRPQRLKVIREEALVMLRGQASIRDVASLDKLHD